MNNLSIISHNGVYVTDSREVAKIVGKQHNNLLRDIKGYEDYLLSSDLSSVDFFIPSSYQDSTGRTIPCYLLTKKGCDMVAHKITGKKGVVFTATYINKFDEMEKALSKPQSPMSIEEMIIMQAQSMIDLKAKVENQDTQLTTLSHRMDNMDALDTIGDLKQRLNNMIKKYVFDNGIGYEKAWNEFNQRFDTAYRTNIGRLKSEYTKAHNLKKRITTPAYLEAVGRLEDGIRVADKMLNPLAAR
jgi:Rha family phage regulatory protein